MSSEITEELKGLAACITGLGERRRTAGRKLLVLSMVEDVAEMAATLRDDMLERVSRDIVLDAEAEDYRGLAELMAALRGVTLQKAEADEEEACRQLDETLASLAELLAQIADQLERRHTNEEYARLYEAENRRYMGSRKARTARAKYEEWLENECYGTPSLEEIDDYRVERLVRMFEKKLLQSKSEHIQRVSTPLKEEIDFSQVDDDKPIKKSIYRNYAALRKLVDWEDGYLVPNPVHIGRHFYATRSEENAKSNRSELLKYLHKINLVQQELRRQLEAEAMAGSAPEGQLNYFAPTKNLKVLLSEEWFEIHRTDECYNHRWTNDLVNALMASEHRDYIATEWASGKRQDYIRGCVLGLLREGGVIRGSMDSIARSAGVCENYRTFSKYMGQCRQEPYAQWVLDYISNKK